MYEHIEKRTLYWLAGLLEGEGSFRKPAPSAPNQPIISVQMTDQDVIERVAACFGTKAKFIRSKHERHKDSYVAIVRGRRAVEMMRLLYPLMSNRRRQQIDSALDGYVGVPQEQGLFDSASKLTVSQVKEIKQRLANGEKPQTICKDYNVSKWAIRHIKSGRTWRNIEI